MSTPFQWQLFEARPLVGILRGFDWPQTRQAVEAIVAGGMNTVEVTLNSPDALRQIQSLQTEFAGKINVGAGTVCKASDAKAAIERGASFLVTPIVAEDVIQVAVQADVPAFVGAMTPTEILRAWDCGASLVKVFPADALGPGYLKSVRGPLAQVRLMPTGGVTVENLAEYLAAGASGFGIGGPLFDKQQIADQNWAWLTDQAHRFVAAYEDAQAVASS